MKKVIQILLMCVLAVTGVQAAASAVASLQPAAVTQQAFQPVHDGLQTFANTISEGSKRLDETFDRIAQIKSDLLGAVGAENDRLQEELNSLLGIAQGLESQIGHAVKATRDAFGALQARGDGVKRWYRKFSSAKVLEDTRKRMGALMAGSPAAPHAKRPRR